MLRGLRGRFYKRTWSPWHRHELAGDENGPGSGQPHFLPDYIEHPVQFIVARLPRPDHSSLRRKWGHFWLSDHWFVKARDQPGLYSEELLESNKPFHYLPGSTASQGLSRARCSTSGPSSSRLFFSHQPAFFSFVPTGPTHSNDVEPPPWEVASHLEPSPALHSAFPLVATDDAKGLLGVGCLVRGPASLYRGGGGWHL